MSRIVTIDPKDGSQLQTYDLMSDKAVEIALTQSRTAYSAWRALPVGARLARLAALEAVLKQEARELATIATREMGKPLTQAIKEVEKCALACRYYASEAERFLTPTAVPTEALKSYIAYQPLGPVLCIMPWNFPYWQVIRFAAPALAAGNTVLLKHAENTTGCALAIERAFLHAGFPEGTFQVLRLDHERIKGVIRDPRVQAVTLTGSERAGSAVASEAGHALKKTVLELGGSDPYIVLEDADVERAAVTSVDSRLVNSGQSCVAAKRFIVVDKVYARFREAFIEHAKAKSVGDPMLAGTDVGPLAKADIRKDVHRQVQETLALGAKAVMGGSLPGGPGFYYPVTVLEDVRPGMPAFDEEVFGPVASLTRARDTAEALALANQSRYGLGAAIFSTDLVRAEKIAAETLEAGFCVVNGMVQSDPRLPFGGIKHSGYGRELSYVGLHEFVNVKTVVIHR